MAKDPPAPDVTSTGDKLVEFYGASQTLYITTAHEVVLGQGLSGDNYVECQSGHDLVLFADKVTVKGRCVAPGRNITIFTRLIEAESVEKAAGKREDPAIIVGGEAGKAPLPLTGATKLRPAAAGWPGHNGAPGAKGADGDPGHIGASGGDAGEIRIFCHKARAPFNLELSARGGAGGNGQNGQNGQDGQDGGPGYSLQFGWNASRAGPTNGGNAGPPGQPGARGEGGKGGNGGKIFFHAHSNDAADGLPNIVGGAVAAGERGRPGEDGNWGEPGKPGAGGRGGVVADMGLGTQYSDCPPGAEWPGKRGPLRPPAYLELDTYEGFLRLVERVKQSMSKDTYDLLWGPAYPVSWWLKARENSRWFLRNPDPFQVVAGSGVHLRGSGEGHLDPRTIIMGNPGSVDVKKGADLGFYLKHNEFKPDFGRLTSYIRMERDRARFLFIEGGTGARDDPEGKDLDEDEKARQLCVTEAKNRIDWANTIIDARTANDHQESNALLPHAASLGEMEHSMQQGRNAFGKEHSWTPNVRFEVYSEWLNSAIVHLADAEVKAKKYREELLSLRTHDNDRRALATAAESSIEEYKKEHDQARNIIFEAKSEIERGEAPVLAAKDKLNQAFHALSKEAQDKANWGELVFGKLLDVVFQVGFMPEEPLKIGMHLAKSASLLGVTAAKGMGKWSPTITGDNGQEVQLNYVLDQVSAMTASVEDLALGFKQLPNGDLLKTDTKMLLTTKANLKKLLEKFWKTSNEIHNCADAMDVLIAAVDARNGAILKMNAALAAYRQAEAQMNSCTKLVNGARQVRAADNLIGLPELVDLIDGYHNEAKERCLRNLYCLSRAYYLWDLPKKYKFFDQFKISGAWNFDSTVAKRIAQQEIDKWQKAIVANWSETGIPTPVKGTENLNQYGEMIVVSENPADGVLVMPEVFESLRENRTADVTLPKSTRDAPVPPFNDKSHVRLRVARCWLKGATSTNGLVRLELTQSGTEIFVTPDNRAVEVTHDPLQIDFAYWADQEGYLEALVSRPGDSVAQDQPKDGNLNDPNHSATYAAIGPFAKWTIRARDDAKTVDLSKVHKIVFEFFVYYRPFEAAAHQCV